MSYLHDSSLNEYVSLSRSIPVSVESVDDVVEMFPYHSFSWYACVSDRGWSWDVVTFDDSSRESRSESWHHFGRIPVTIDTTPVASERENAQWFSAKVSVDSDHPRSREDDALNAIVSDRITTHGSNFRWVMDHHIPTSVHENKKSASNSVIQIRRQTYHMISTKKYKIPYMISNLIKKIAKHQTFFINSSIISRHIENNFISQWFTVWNNTHPVIAFQVHIGIIKCLFKHHFRPYNFWSRSKYQ